MDEEDDGLDDDHRWYEEDLACAEKAGEPWFSFDSWKKKRDEWETNYHESLRVGLDEPEDIEF
jgi:hypothetical protein